MSKLKVSAIHDPDNDNEALTIDTSGNVSFSGTVSGAMPDAIDVNASAPADSLSIDANGNSIIKDSAKLITKTSSGEVIRFERASDNARYSSIYAQSLDAGQAYIQFKVHDGVTGTSLADVLTLKGDGRGLSQFTAKVWINFNGTGSVAIRDSHNVSSITDNAVGKTTINFSNNLGNANYSTVGTTSNVNNNFSVDDPSHPTTSSVQVVTRDVEANTNEDSELVSVLIFGD